MKSFIIFSLVISTIVAFPSPQDAKIKPSKFPKKYNKLNDIEAKKVNPKSSYLSYDLTDDLTALQPPSEIAYLPEESSYLRYENENFETMNAPVNLPVYLGYVNVEGKIIDILTPPELSSYLDYEPNTRDTIVSTADGLIHLTLQPPNFERQEPEESSYTSYDIPENFHFDLSGLSKKDVPPVHTE